MRCSPNGPFTPNDVQTLATFLRDYRGKLLVDLRHTDPTECARHIKHLRPMMPIAAIFGAELPAGTLDLDRSYYAHPVEHFASEEQCLNWLRAQ
jgi:hypothetical protein